ATCRLRWRWGLKTAFASARSRTSTTCNWWLDRDSCVEWAESSRRPCGPYARRWRLQWTAVKTVKNKVAIVTGASRGIGRGVAIGLGEAGWTVYLTGRTVRDDQSDRRGTITKTAAEVSSAGGRGIPVPCDHSIDADTAAVFGRVMDEQGHL